MSKVACLTMDLEPDLRCPDSRIRLLEDDGKLTALIDLLAGEAVPLTCFTVMSVAAHYADQMKSLAREAEIEFAVHSFSHNIAEPASEREVKLSWDAYCDLWNAEPWGYRAPNCLIDAGGLARLLKQGYRYDSSIVPSIRFDEYGYNNLKYACRPFRFADGESTLLEFPIACLPVVRVPFVFSYIKLLGLPAYRAASAMLHLPDTLITYFHPYDLYIGEISAHLSGWKRYAHLRNADRAWTVLRKTVRMLRNGGYRFVTMRSLTSELTADASLPLCALAGNAGELTGKRSYA